MKIVETPITSKNESAPDSVESWAALFSHFGGVRSPQPFRRYGSPLSACSGNGRIFGAPVEGRLMVSTRCSTARPRSGPGGSTGMTRSGTTAAVSASFRTSWRRKKSIHRLWAIRNSHGASGRLSSKVSSFRTLGTALPERCPRRLEPTRSCANSSGAGLAEDWLWFQGTPGSVPRTDHGRSGRVECPYLSIRSKSPLGYGQNL